MLTWDDEVKPTPLQMRTGNYADLPEVPAPLSAAPSRRVLDDGALPAPAVAKSPATVQAAKEASAHRVNAADKRIINGQTDVNQLVPFK
ncbi:MAG: ribonucleotide-diphosphate reductase subunit beta, partial [Pseudomonadota bacterium]